MAKSGSKVSSHKYPFVVQINSADHFCGGSLVDLDKVITAAHCVYNSNSKHFSPPSSLTVIAGSLTHKTDDEGDSTQKRSVVGIQTPEGTESPFRTDQDIALLFLSEPFQETVYVKKIGTTSYITLDDDRPSNKIIAFISSKMVSTIPSKFQLTTICSVAEEDDSEMGGLVVAGMGYKLWDVKVDQSQWTRDPYLKELHLKHVATQECVSAMGGSSEYKTCTNQKAIFCVRQEEGKGDRTCGGDSGSTATRLKGKSAHCVLGVLALGAMCPTTEDNAYPMQYTRINEYKQERTETETDQFNLTTGIT
ncbi:ovochymase-2-like [Symsagittifera roscoffensis]|uniref:ovochymase-2-like n=1 Tax=Symsagittifera roscoffensis TaxID=84072 RepID=UPI00307BE427